MKLHSKKFSQVRRISYPKSTFDVSHSHQGSYDWGYLYPIFYEETTPGDYWRLAQQMVAKMMPTIAPIQHEVNAFVHYYFVPYRIIDENWEEFITGGKLGTDESVLPIWNPTTEDKTVGSLWDHFGFPLTDCQGVEPIDYMLRAYNMIWSEYYRDENLTDEVPYPYTENSYMSNTAGSYGLNFRAWEKDYFTASLPWQQRGIAPALPISGITAAIFEDLTGMNIASIKIPPNTGGPYDSTVKATSTSGSPNLTNLQTVGNATETSSRDLLAIGNGVSASALDHNTVDLSEATTFEVADI